MNKLSFALATLLAAAPLAAPAADAAASTNARPPSGLSPATEKLNNLFGNTILARGKGLEVNRGQLDKAAVSLKGGAAARGQTIPPEQMKLVEAQLLDRMIQLQLLVGTATDADRAKAKEAFAKRLELTKKQAGGEEGLQRTLKAIGLSLPDLSEQMEKESIAEAVVERELKIEISDEAIKKYYEDFPSQFEQPESVRVSHILASVKDPEDQNPNPLQRRDLPDEQKKLKLAKVDGLLKQARAGEDFNTLAKANSDDRNLQSGEIQVEYTFARGRMVPQFEAAAFSLQTNQISDIVTTPYGYHIIKLNEKLPAKKVELEKVKDDVRQFLKAQETTKRLPAMVAKLREEAKVEILDPNLVLKLPETNAPPALTPPAPEPKK